MSWKSLTIGTLLILTMLGIVLFQSTPSIITTYKDLEQAEFEDYITRFSKSYSSEEYSTRFEYFLMNSGYIRAFNTLGETWVLGLTEYSDMSAEDFTRTYLNYSPVSSKSSDFSKSPYTYPASVDWRTQGAVTPVGNQGQCSSSWAFSAVGAVEGAWQIAGNPLVSLSEQQLLDCSSRYGNNGCSGGTMDYSFLYIISNGLTSDANYPYTAKQGTCQTNTIIASITSFNDVSPNSPSALYTAVAQQPVSVAVDADPAIWQNYKGGVISRNCGTELNLGVLVVGYNSNSNPAYWIVKNAFGQNWGENGYIRLAVVDGQGVCGVQMAPSYPNIK